MEIKDNGNSESFEEIKDTLDRNVLSDNCKALLKEVESHNKVYFIENKEIGSWASTFMTLENGERVAIVYYHDDYVDEYAVHELLHLSLDSKFKAWKLSKMMHEEVEKDPRMKVLFQKNQIDLVINIIEHNLFFARFLSLGYDRNRFFEQDDFRHVENSTFLNNPYIAQNTLEYVAQFLSVALSCVMFPDKDRWAEQNKKLKKSNKPFFNVIETLRKNVDSCIGGENLQNRLEKACKEFLNGCVNWMNIKGISFPKIN